jgi:hypothetical protein
MFNSGVFAPPNTMVGGFVGGSGTLNFVAKWTPDGVTIGDSQIFDDGTNIGVNNISPTVKFDIASADIGVAPVLAIYNTVAATNNSGAQMLFSANRNTGGRTSVAGISGIITDVTNGAYKGALGFYTANNTTPAEVGRFDYAGNFGVGLTSVGARINVKGSGSTSATYTAIFQNSSNTPLLALRDDGVSFFNNPPTGTIDGFDCALKVFGAPPFQIIRNTNVFPISMCFAGINASGTYVNYALFSAVPVDSTAGAEYGKLVFTVRSNGNFLNNVLEINSTGDFTNLITNTVGSYRPVNTVGLGTGFDMKLNNSNSATVTYTSFNGGIVSNTAGAENGILKLFVVNNGVLTQYLSIDNNGLFTLNSRFCTAIGASIAAANNLTLGLDGNTFTITGNTTINAITTANWNAGTHITLMFTGTPTIKNNTAGGAGTAVLLLAGSADLIAANNTILGLFYDGTQWQETFRKVA